MDDDQQFCLRWNNHQSTLVAVFDTLLENGTLVDCTLAAEGKFLNAHKVVLSACSPYFEQLLSKHFDKHPILILKDVKFQELKAMMDYMYRGEVNISQDQLGALLKAAESLQIKGLSDNRKGETERKPAPAPPPPKSPQPTSVIPKVQGLTIEQRGRDDSREGSMSPGPRKKKRLRRKSEELDNHDASNSSESHSLPAAQNIPTLPAVTKMNADVPEQVETKSEILTRHIQLQQTDEMPKVPIIKEKIETHTELMLEPKSEYVDEMNEDSIEDLTLDDDDLSNMEQMDDGAGPSHGNTGEGSSQGFGGWHMGNQSQDEVFLAAQEAVGAHRDSQDDMKNLQQTVQFPIIDMSRFFKEKRIRKIKAMPEISFPTRRRSAPKRKTDVPYRIIKYLNKKGESITNYQCKKCGRFLNKKTNKKECSRCFGRKQRANLLKQNEKTEETVNLPNKNIKTSVLKVYSNKKKGEKPKQSQNGVTVLKTKVNIITDVNVEKETKPATLKRKRQCDCIVLNGKINICSNCLNKSTKSKTIEKPAPSKLAVKVELNKLNDGLLSKYIKLEDDLEDSNDATVAKDLHAEENIITDEKIYEIIFGKNIKNIDKDLPAEENINHNESVNEIIVGKNLEDIDKDFPAVEDRNEKNIDDTKNKDKELPTQENINYNENINNTKSGKNIDNTKEIDLLTQKNINCNEDINETTAKTFIDYTEDIDDTFSEHEELHDAYNIDHNYAKI